MNKHLIGAIVAVAFATSAQAATVVADFDELAVGSTVDNFYAGLSFTPGDWEVQTGFGQTSQPNFAFSRSGLGQVNTSFGFNSLSFTAGVFVPSILEIYSGLSGTGTLLATINLVDPPYGPSAFAPASASWSGTARSVIIGGGGAQFGWDDLTFGVVPEPATWIMLIAGFGLVGVAARRRAAVAAA